jgi:hypothetical protein
MTDDHSKFNPEQRRQFWKEHLDLWQREGGSQSAYCRQHDLKLHQFTYWKKRLAQTDTITFVPLQLARRPPHPVVNPVLNLVTPNGFRIEISAGFDPAILQRLIGAVRSL